MDDIGNLFDVVSDIDVIKATFFKFAETELAYRNQNEEKIIEVLDDIFFTSLCIVTKGADGKGNFKQLQLGIKRLSSFIISESYYLEKAIIHASKAAYLSTLIKHDAPVIEKFGNPIQLKNLEIATPLNTKLNKLKKSNPEAFFYWYKIYKLLSK